jgi:hypothetical protein
VTPTPSPNFRTHHAHGFSHPSLAIRLWYVLDTITARSHVTHRLLLEYSRAFAAERAQIERCPTMRGVKMVGYEREYYGEVLDG